ncbi:hypothetical protein BC940DRAFT_305201 [Gongronella butleri]|nr:hypothetical protein BC940DRAFT_305201 [Gongronella butleri]
MSWIKDIDAPELRASVERVFAQGGEAASVLEALAVYYQSRSDHQETKKRKVVGSSQDDADAGVVKASLVDISVAQPVRKKLTLSVTSSHVKLMNKDETVVSVRCDAIAHAAVVPTPEKPRGAWTVALLMHDASAEAIVFSVADKGALRVVSGTEETKHEDADAKRKALSAFLGEFVVRANQLLVPDRQAYTCTGVNSSTGKMERERPYVTTHLRTKEGALYFLPQGILFGFKKPTLFVPANAIAATLFTSITQRTFDLNVCLQKDAVPLGAARATLAPWETDDGLAFTFSMIDQSEYGGITDYTQRLKIVDSSISEATKAVEHNVNAGAYKKEDNEDDENDENDANSPAEQHAAAATAQFGSDDEDDDDFDASDSDHDPLEYDSDAGSDVDGSEGELDQDDMDIDENADGAMDDGDELDDSE